MAGDPGFEPGPTDPESANAIIKKILYHLVALGQAAQELLASIGNNGHRAEMLTEIKEILESQARK